jgi:hypothetical protein
MDLKLLIWELVANRLVAEHKTLKVPKPGNNIKSKKRRGRQNKKRPDTDDSSSDEETDSNDFAKTARAVALVLKGKEMSSVDCDFMWKGMPFGYQMFPEPKQSKQSPPGQAARKYSCGNDKKKQKLKKLNHESIEIVAMARSTVPKGEKTTINPPKESRCYLDSGATCSMYFSRQAFVPGSLHVCDTRPILLADTSEIRANMSGDVILEFPKEDDGPTVILRITGCFYVGKLADKGVTSIFQAETVELKIEPKTLFLAEVFVIVKTRASTSCLLLNNMNTLWFQSTVRKALGPGTKE